MSNKKPSSSKGFDFVFRACVYALLIMAILHTFKPYMEGSKVPVNSAEAEALVRNVEIISPEAIIAKIKTTKKPTVLMVYASWCGYCRNVVSSVLTLQQSKEHAGKHFIFVSLDRKLADLATYILENRYEKLIQPLYVVNSDMKNDLNALGSSYKGSIPYVAVFNANGELVAEHSGMWAATQLESTLKTH